MPTRRRSPLCRPRATIAAADARNSRLNRAANQSAAQTVARAARAKSAAPVQSTTASNSRNPIASDRQLPRLAPRRRPRVAATQLSPVPATATIPSAPIAWPPSEPHQRAAGLVRPAPHALRNVRQQRHRHERPPGPVRATFRVTVISSGMIFSSISMNDAASIQHSSSAWLINCNEAPASAARSARRSTVPN